jgi:hypothetical protein
VKEGDTRFIIENKLWARDQPDQLERYLNDIKKGDGFLVYLSIEKREEESGHWSRTISPESKKSAIAQGRLFLTHYKLHMNDWIDECQKIVESDKIRWFLNEIKQLVSREFYGGNSLMDHDNAMVEYLMKDRKAFETAFIVVSNFDKVKETLAQKYVSDISEKLKEAIQEFKNWDITTDDGKSIIVKSKDDCGMTIDFGFYKTPYHNSYYAIRDEHACKTGGKERSEYADKIKEKATESLQLSSLDDDRRYPWWTQFKSGQYWLASDFLMQLHKFHNKDESSVLFEDAKILVCNMRKLLEILDDVFKNKRTL